MEKFRPDLHDKCKGRDGDIQDEIERLYYNGYEFTSSADLKSKYDRIVTNKMGSVEKSTNDRMGSFLTSAQMMCYYYLKYAKKDRKYLLNLTGNRKFHDVGKRLKKIVGHLLSDGVYHCQIDKKNFLVLFVNSSDYNDYDTRLYFIGKKYDKYQKEYLKLEKELLEEYRKRCKESVIVNIGQYGNVRNVVTFKPFDKMVFRNKENVLAYVDNWKKNIPLYYDKYNMIPKLSILLYGKPGTGKSTFYQALADRFDISCVNCIQAGYFRQKRYTATDPAIYAIDDIDTFIGSREEDDDKEKYNTISNEEMLSSILAFLDHPPTFNFNAGNGMYYPVSIVVATTNYIDKLDPAIKRYGRFDLKIPMDDFDYELATIFSKLYNIHLEDIVEVKNKDKFTISPAELQAKCMENIDKQLKEV